MKAHRSKYLRTGSLCLLTSSLSYQAYGCTLDGIDIQAMLSPIVQRSSGVAKAKSSVQQKSKVKEKINLDEILEGHPHLETAVMQVQVRLSKNEKAKDLLDTDEEKEETKAKGRKVKARTAIGLATIGNKNKKECLLIQKD